MVMKTIQNVLAFLLGTLLVFLIWASITANAEGKNNTIKIAIMPTFGAHQHIGYEVIDRMKAQGINVETVIIKSSTQGNGLLMNKQIDVNVGAITSFILLDNKKPGEGKLLSAVSHYKFFLLCTPDIKNMQDVLTTNIVTSGRNTTEHHTIRWLAKKHFNDAYALEKNFITMSRPQIYQIMKAGSKDIKCVMTGAPLQNQLQDELGLKVIEQSDVDNGIAGSYNVYWTRTDFAKANPKIIEAFVKTTVGVIDEYNQDPTKILNSFITKDKLKFTKSYLLKSYKKNKSVFHYDLRGAEYFNDFLHEIGYIKGDKTDLNQATFDLNLIQK